MISTDTCTFTREQKAMWEGDWTKIPMGMPGLETLMPLTYTKGVLGGRLTLEEMCAKLSTNPAKIMGLARARARSRSVRTRTSRSSIRPHARRGEPRRDGDERGLVAVSRDGSSPASRARRSRAAR